jgi:transcriptional regulator GlxA family with amidase domain
MLKVAVLLFDGVEELDFAGPLEVFGQAASVFTVGPSREIRGRHGLRVIPDFTFADAPQPDVLVVPGGPVTRENPDSLLSSVTYVMRAAPACRLVLSVCTGAFILAMAGQLYGRHATTHFKRRSLLQDTYPEVKLRHARVVDNGKIITTAGVSAGIEGALWAVSRLFGLARAREVAHQIEYAWQPNHVVIVDEYRFPEETGQAMAW